jgi:hypothetical protein
MHGERLLRMLVKDGAQITAGGIYTKHILKQLNIRRKHGTSNLLGCLIALGFVTG